MESERTLLSFLGRRVNRGQAVWLAVVSPLVCTATLSLAGGAYGVSMADPPLSLGTLGVALLDGVLYSLILALPVGLVFGVGGALLASGLARGALLRARKARWIRVGGGIGATLGTLATLCFSVLTADVDPRSDVLWFALASVGSAALAGAAVGWLAWREYGS